MTPQEALGAAFLTAIPDETWESTYPFISVTAEFTEAILDALAADGWTVARTQDARDGEALRLLREAAETTGGRVFIHTGSTDAGPWVSVEIAPPVDFGPPRVYLSRTRPTIAEAADACREAVEATRK